MAAARATATGQVTAVIVVAKVTAKASSKPIFDRNLLAILKNV